LLCERLRCLLLLSARATEVYMPFVRIGDSLPSGATLFYMDGDIPMRADFAAQGRTVRFNWDVRKVPNAQGIQWQVHVARADIEQIAVSGKGSGAQGSFSVDFATIPRPPSRMGATGVNDPLWYVRVLPLGSAGNVAGQPSNVIRVYDKSTPPMDPKFQIKIDAGQWYVKPGAPIRMTRFESVPYRYVDEWPPGCEHYRGGGQQTPWGWAAGAVKDAFDWTSQAYDDAQNYVVTGVVTIFPFVPRSVAKTALQAALASAGIPPSIPNLNQMLTHGSDYLAGQMVDQLAAEVPAGSELAQLGKEELRKRIQEKARDAIMETARNIREPGADSKYCVGKEYPPFLKITVQNASTQTCTDVEIKLSMSFDSAALGYTDFSVSNQPGLPSYYLLPLHGPLLRPFEPFHINRIDPGQSLTIPVDIFSHWNVDAVPYDTSTGTGLTGKDVSHWRGFYKFGQFSFTVDGGRTVKYRAMSENGRHLEEQFVDDGVGFSFKSPKRAWMDEPFAVAGMISG
jgi:hypothetical protein